MLFGSNYRIFTKLHKMISDKVKLKNKKTPQNSEMSLDKH